MKAKLAKKNRFSSVFTFVFALLGCIIPDLAKAQANAQRCDWQNIGTHRQTKLLPLCRKDLSGQGTHFVSIAAALAQHEGNFYLQIYIEIDDATAAALLGEVKPAAIIKLMPAQKAENISLVCPKGATANLQNNRLSYNCIYSLDKKSIAKLAQLEIGQIELQWANGQQKYDVFDVDFFRRLMPCAK